MHALAELDLSCQKGQEHVLAREYRGRLERQPAWQQRRAAVHHVVKLARLARHDAVVRFAQKGRQLVQRNHSSLARPPIECTRDGAVRCVRGHGGHDELRAHRAVRVASKVQGVRFDLGCVDEQLIEHVGRGHTHFRLQMLQQLCELVALKAATIWDAKLLDPHGNLSCASALQRHAQSRIACASAEARCTTGGHDASDADRPDSHCCQAEYAVQAAG